MPSGYFLSSKEEVNNKKAGIVTMNYGDMVREKLIWKI